MISSELRGQAVVRVGVVQRALVAAVAVAVDADGLAVVVGRVRGAVLDAEARHDLDELGRVGAELHEVLQFLGGQAVGVFSGIDRTASIDVPVTSTMLVVLPTFMRRR